MRPGSGPGSVCLGGRGRDVAQPTPQQGRVGSTGGRLPGKLLLFMLLKKACSRYLCLQHKDRVSFPPCQQTWNPET